MDGKIKRTDYLEGVTVRVVSKKNGFDVTITIEPGTSLWVGRKNENFWIKFDVKASSKVTKRKIRFKATNQQYDRAHVLSDYRKVFTMENSGKCYICLAPTFFLPEELAEESRRLSEQRKLEGKRAKHLRTGV